MGSLDWKISTSFHKELTWLSLATHTVHPRSLPPTAFLPPLLNAPPSPLNPSQTRPRCLLSAQPSLSFSFSARMSIGKHRAMNTTRHATGSPVLSRPSTSSSRRSGAVGCERLMATEGRYGKHEAMESARRPRLFYTVFLKHFIKASGYCAVVSRAAMGSVASPLVLGPAI